jgi:hypothetical protein
MLRLVRIVQGLAGKNVPELVQKVFNFMKRNVGKCVKKDIFGKSLITLVNTVI